MTRQRFTKRIGRAGIAISLGVLLAAGAGGGFALAQSALTQVDPSIRGPSRRANWVLRATF